MHIARTICRNKKQAEPAMDAPAKQPPQQALVVKRECVERIFKNGKTWELRGANLQKRGRCCHRRKQDEPLNGRGDLRGSFSRAVSVENFEV